MYVVGLWETTGEHVPKNVEDGLALLRKAAEKNYGPALYEVGIRQIEGRDLPKDPASGLEKMRHASVLGSPPAQYYLGNQYETGTGVPRELDRARRYFRLCAAQGVSVCQYRLGALLLAPTERPERDYVQAVAWFQLAGENGNREARDIALREAASMSQAQIAWVTNLKSQLVRK
jgi:localization factor PodJL